MLYYTIYLKNLHNSTGYIDIGLEDDTLLRDYQHFLDVGLLSHKIYPLPSIGKTGNAGVFLINFSEVMAMTVTPPQKAGPTQSSLAPSPQ